MELVYISLNFSAHFLIILTSIGSAVNAEGWVIRETSTREMPFHRNDSRSFSSKLFLIKHGHIFLWANRQLNIIYNLYRTHGRGRDPFPLKGRSDDRTMDFLQKFQQETETRQGRWLSILKVLKILELSHWPYYTGVREVTSLEVRTTRKVLDSKLVHSNCPETFLSYLEPTSSPPSLSPDSILTWSYRTDETQSTSHSELLPSKLYPPLAGDFSLEENYADKFKIIQMYRLHQILNWKCMIKENTMRENSHFFQFSNLRANLENHGTSINICLLVHYIDVRFKCMYCKI